MAAAAYGKPVRHAFDTVQDRLCDRIFAVLTLSPCNLLS
jgi:hypothetical protein